MGADGMMGRKREVRMVMGGWWTEKCSPCVAKVRLSELLLAARCLVRVHQGLQLESIFAFDY